jgi:hypothetical protein
MSLTIFAPETDHRPGAGAVSPDHTTSVNPVRNTLMNPLHYSHVQEIQRERLRQAESYRVYRLALRARRAVASQIVR